MPVSPYKLFASDMEFVVELTLKKLESWEGSQLSSGVVKSGLKHD
jgi:hypothetical protein